MKYFISHKQLFFAKVTFLIGIQKSQHFLDYISIPQHLKKLYMFLIMSHVLHFHSK